MAYKRKKSSTPGTRSKARTPSRKKTKAKGPSKAQIRQFMRAKYGPSESEE